MAASGTGATGKGQVGADGITRIVEVGAKPETAREAVAEAWLVTTPEAVGHLVAGTKKGSPIESAKLAGVIGVKRTTDLLPHCHPICNLPGKGIALGQGRIKFRSNSEESSRAGLKNFL